MADATTVAALAGAGGVLAGTLVSSVATLYRERLVSRREREAREHLRIQQRADERALFQRESILEWLDAIGDLQQIAARTNEERLAVQVETGQWPDPGVGAPFPEGFTAAYARLGLAAARLFDQHLRATTRRLQQELGESVVARTAELEWMRLGRAGAIVGELQDRANALLEQFFGATPGATPQFVGPTPGLSPLRPDPGPSMEVRQDGEPA
jgi:hypothetical protein